MTEQPLPSRFEIGRDGPSALLVAFDGTPTALRAGAYAAGMARRERCRLVVVHVTTVSTMASLIPYAAPYIEDTRDQATADLRRQIEDGRAYAGVDSEFVARRGDPYIEITKVADEINADAVLVGASTGAGHKLVGSLAVRLVRCGKWPVTVVP